MYFRGPWCTFLEPRYSIPFFLEPNMDTRIGGADAPTCLDLLGTYYREAALWAHPLGHKHLGASPGQTDALRMA